MQNREQKQSKSRVFFFLPSAFILLPFFDPMTFLNPILMFGLAAVAIPIVVHLLNKRKVERVDWAAMRFLRTSFEQNQQRLKLEDLLLLLLRCLIVLHLAIALARPVLKSASAGLFGQSGVTAVFIVDQSYSMSQTDGTRSRFDKAKIAAGQAIDALPPGSAAAVWMSSDGVSPIIPEPTFDLNLARASIANAKLSDRRTDVLPAIRRALDTLGAQPHLQRELYLFTDGQANGWKQIDEIRKMLEDARQQVQTHIIFITSHEEQNLGIADLRQISGLVAVDQSLRFSVKVTNYGSAEAHDVRVTLRVDKGDTADESSIASIPPHDSRSVSLFAQLHAEGYHSITASIPTDALPADDVRTIAVRAIAKVKVLLVDGNPGFSDRESEVFFIRNVFGSPGSTADADRDHQLVRATVITPSSLVTTNLDEFDAVVLADVHDFSAETLDAFASYLQRGGGLLVFPGDHMQTSFYNDHLLDQFHFLPAAFAPPRGDPNAKEKLLSLQDKGFDHPIAAIWNDPASGSPAAANFFRITPLTPDTVAVSNAGQVIGDPRIIMKFSDGTPAIMERTWGLGRVIQFASTASTRWNDLPVHPGIFVPLLYRSLGAIVGRQDEGLNIRAGDKWIFHPGVELLGKEATFVRPNQDAAAPRDSRRIELSQRLPILTYDDTDVAGVYDVSIADAPPMKFAVQPDPEESHLEELSDAEKHSLDAGATVIEWTPTMSLQQELARRRLGTELWMPIATIVLIFAAAETFLAHWFSRPK